MKRVLLIITGCLALGIGVLGIVVPLLPTTPFLLVSASCFLKSSDSLYTWLITQKHIGRYIYCYKHYKAVSMRSKTFTILLLWTAILSSIVLIEIFWVRLLLVTIAIGVSTHIGMLHAVKPDMLKAYETFRETALNNR